jgi:hypothetical protein
VTVDVGEASSGVEPCEGDALSTDTPAKEYARLPRARQPELLAPAAAPPGLGHHLLHRPGSAESVMLGTAAPVAQEFTLSARLPEHHPLFNDGPGIFHDLHYPIEAMRESVLFVAHQYFRVPAARPVVLASTEAVATDLEAWRRGTEPSHISVDMVLHPVDVINGVPRGLTCEARLSIDGVRCGDAKARTVFLMPKVYHNHRARGRAASRGNGYSVPALDERPPAEAVGRCDPRNVVIGTPVPDDGGRLRIQVSAQPAHPVFAAGATDHVPSTVLLEASRQLAILAAGELHGFSASSCALGGWAARFQGFAEIDLPLMCTLRAEELRRDAAGRRVFPVALTFSQGARELATVTVEVIQDY